ncbi:hypothetical protein GGI15_001923 [Coemansia interrupta]|uniref:ELYS-like domain-containing protein n=1 Tax=Coemansia interrupta TaxID=1126814 RepID=A0A9W8HHR2_9FUNG|nr:hypothetical protein GGI15_001923 [Coemansia interrupta]
MELISTFAAVPNHNYVEPIAGGVSHSVGAVASDNAEATTAESCPLMYRFSPHTLEIHNLSTAALRLSDPLATLSATQLQATDADASADLEIALVQPVAINGSTVFLVFARDASAKSATLSLFSPFDLLVYPLTTAPVHYRTRSISVSKSLVAGSGSTTEWEYAVVCFGLPGGRALIGNLSLTGGRAQITAVEKLRLDSHKTDVVCSFLCPLPGSDHRLLAFLGLASGHIAVVEYMSYGENRTRVVIVIPPTSSNLGPPAKISAKFTSSRQILLAIAHSASSHKDTSASTEVAAVVSHSLDISSGNRGPLTVTASTIGTMSLQFMLRDDFDFTHDFSANFPRRTLSAADFVDLAVFDVYPQGSDGPSTTVVAALANSHVERLDHTMPSSKSISLHAVFNAWALDHNKKELVSVSCQNSLTPCPAFGMQVSGAAGQVAVVSSRQVLLGDAIAGGLLSLIDNPDDTAAVVPEMSPGRRTPQPLSISEYIDANASFVYSDSLCSALAEQRRRMDGELFVDLLLQMIATPEDSPSCTYPPANPAELLELVSLVGASDLDGLKQRCIAYYLLLDLSATDLVSDTGIYAASSNDPTAHNVTADRYVRENFIPRHFEYLIRGYWLMDHAQTAASLSYLADPCVIADWAPKILRTAVAAGCYPEASVFLNSATATMPPRLDEQPSEAPVIMDVLLNCDFDRAFSFQRLGSSSPELRQVLLSQLFALALSPHARRSTVDRLAMLPFDPTEESALEKHCLLPDAAPHAKDFLSLYFVDRGRYAEAIRLFRATSRETEGQQLSAAQKKKRDERLMMVQNLTLLLPPAQRSVLEELESASDIQGNDTRFVHRRMDRNRPDQLSGDSQMAMDYEAASPSEHHDASVPLSASKSARQLHSAASAQGASGAASNALLRVLARQMVTVQPLTQQASVSDGSMPATPTSKAGYGYGAASATPWKTPLTSFPDRSMSSAQHLNDAEQSPSAGNRVTNSVSSRSAVARVPFSGPPTTPRMDGTLQNYLGASPQSNIDPFGIQQSSFREAPAHGDATKPSSSISRTKRSSGSSLEADGGNLSPFAMAKSRSPAAKVSSSGTNLPSAPSTPKNTAGRQTNGPDIDSSARRYNLRHRIPSSNYETDDKTTENDSMGDVAPAAADAIETASATVNTAKDKGKAKTKKRSSKSRSKRAKNSKDAQKSETESAAPGLTAENTNASARSFERSVSQTSETATPRQSSRIRKRTEQL